MIIFKPIKPIRAIHGGLYSATLLLVFLSIYERNISAADSPILSRSRPNSPHIPINSLSEESDLDEELKTDEEMESIEKTTPLGHDAEKKDLRELREQYHTKALSKGDPDSCYYYAIMAFNGAGGVQDTPSAIDYLYFAWQKLRHQPSLMRLVGLVASIPKGKRKKTIKQSMIDDKHQDFIYQLVRKHHKDVVKYDTVEKIFKWMNRRFKAAEIFRIIVFIETGDESLFTEEEIAIAKEEGLYHLILSLPELEKELTNRLHLLNWHKNRYVNSLLASTLHSL